MTRFLRASTIDDKCKITEGFIPADSIEFVTEAEAGNYYKVLVNGNFYLVEKSEMESLLEQYLPAKA